MKRISCFLAGVFLFSIVGCQFPQWRVMQAKVPAGVGKTQDQIEAERQAADLLAHRIEKPESLKPVAAGLSESLGKPAKPITEPDTVKASDDATEGLRREVLAYQKRVAVLNAKLAKYDGMEIEGTGINLFGGSVVLSIGAFIAAIIFIPGFGVFALWAVRRLRIAMQQMAEGVEGFSADKPQAAEELKEWLSSSMDKGPKRIIKRLKPTLDMSNVNEVLRKKAAMVG